MNLHKRPAALVSSDRRVILAAILAFTFASRTFPIGSNSSVGSFTTEKLTEIPSVLSVEANPFGNPATPTSGRLVRLTLTPGEFLETLHFHLEFFLQNEIELQDHIKTGRVLAPAELEKYLPSREAYRAVESWLISNGFTITLESNFRNTLFATGTFAQAAAAFHTEFGRVSTADGEFSSALIEPSMPAGIAPSIKAIRGLQPHLRRHHSPLNLPPISVPQGYMDPGELLVVYRAPVNLDGSGQTIAIICDAAPLTSDLVLYWNTCGIPQSLDNFTVVNVQGGPGSNTADLDEASVDVEWASSIAQGASIRLYATPAGLTSDTEAAAYTQILNDLPSNPGLHQVSESFGGPEGDTDSSIALLAAQGVSCFASSGDGGSNPNLSNGAYDSAASLGVLYPASDPNVTGVGGTAIDIQEGEIIGPETAWGLTTSGQLQYATTGGFSTFVPRPPWQTGAGVPPGDVRCVPDVAAMAYNVTEDGIGEAPLYIDNATNHGVGGTSLASPVWAGFCAIMNQGMAEMSFPPIGNLNPKIYPLIGTAAFNDIILGNNGAYSAGVGYDLCSGVGTPNVGYLLDALEPQETGLSVSVDSQIPTQSVVNGSAPITLTAVVNGYLPSYQWLLNGSPIAGATDAVEVVYPTAANQGAYSVIVHDPFGTYANASAGTLTVSTDAWIVNLSARAFSETGNEGANQLIAGFVTEGQSAVTGLFYQKSILIRGDGPSLAQFGITDFLPDPQLTLVSATGTVASTDSWSTDLDATFDQVGAYPLTAGSHDTALLETLYSGPYTAQVISQTTNNGVALAEIYDADNLAPAARLINISARAFVGTGPDILIGGFVISGNTPLTVVIRGDGPALANFGLTGVLQNTTLTLSNSSSQTIATNSGWNNPPVAGLAATGGILIQTLTGVISSEVGGFSFELGSNDSALVATLPPGAYTAQVSGTNGATGVALVEIYELR